MSAQPAVLQVVILRDGLLVGTEVFVPGHYTLGSGATADLHLDDPSVADAHAHLFFQNGRAAIQDAGSGGVFVNGHRVNACEVRAVDEVACGPFTLKIRVMSQRPNTKPAPSAEVSAILGNAHPPPSRPPVPPPPSAPQAAPPSASPQRPAPAQRTNAVPAPTVSSRPQPPATVVSSRRQGNTAPAAVEPVVARAPHLRPVPVDESESRTESVQVFNEFLEPFAHPEPSPHPLKAAPIESLDALLSPPSPKEPPRAVKPHTVQAADKGQGHQPTRARQQRSAPTLPAANEGKGKAQLFVESYWGDIRRFAGSYGSIDPKKKLVAAEDDACALPMFGFGLEPGFVFAEQKGEVFRVYVPPRAAVERRAQDGNFYPVQTDTLEVGPGQRRCITLGSGHAVRFAGDDDMTVVAYVQSPLPKPFVSPLKGLPWLVLVFMALFGSGFLTFVWYFGELPENADFQSKTVNPVAVKLIAPPKPEEKKKLAEKVEKLTKPDKKVAKVDKAPPKAMAAETKKALKSIEKLSAAGPAMKDLMAAVDKLGSGPGMKGAKNDFKLSGLIGKQPIASAGLGTFGLGGGGAGGMGIKGAELLRGKGGGGIGALGAGNVGKGSVAGTVTHASSRSVAAQGSIDKEAVAKVINSHLHEVSSCYERALLKTPGLAGKIVLEWQITITGVVGYAKTKSSSMQSAAVESCILGTLKTWRFPPAKGAGVVITYPFMFNSVGY